jgi:hypothetical protein
MYNRYAESGRVNWVTSFAANAPPEERQQWLDIMSPRSIGLILKSIRTDYKLVSNETRAKSCKWLIVVSP